MQVLESAHSTLEKRQIMYQLSACLLIGSLNCGIHAEAVTRKLKRIITNVYFNNHCKRKAEEQLEDNVKLFKKIKREKRSV